jgi:hypothetical protein
LEVRSQVTTCQSYISKGPKGIVSRILAALRFRRELRHCGDFLLDDPPPNAFVREPRRPRPLRPGGAIALELPTDELLN